MEFVEYVNAILQAQQTKYVIKIMVSVFVTQTLLVQNVINVHRDFIITQIVCRVLVMSRAQLAKTVHRLVKYNSVIVMKAGEDLLVISVHLDTTHQIVLNVNAMSSVQSVNHAILSQENANANLIL